jgi:hypothetical protein
MFWYVLVCFGMLYHEKSGNPDLNAQQETNRPCPLKSRRHFQLPASHIRTVLSPEVDATNLPSDEKCADITELP